MMMITRLEMLRVLRMMIIGDLTDHAREMMGLGVSARARTTRRTTGMDLLLLPLIVETVNAVVKLTVRLERLEAGAGHWPGHLLMADFMTTELTKLLLDQIADMHLERLLQHHCRR